MSNEVNPYYFREPIVKKAPILLSLPHNGVEFPEELTERYDTQQKNSLDDTDWYLDQLYDFAPSLGITTIYAKYSRWVIDLNREPDSTPLYNDGRLTTALCPTTNFLGEPLYTKKDFEPNEKEKLRRLNEYYFPYHKRIDKELSEIRDEFGYAIFWDGHSIRRLVKTIQKDPLPDLILGNNDGKTADGKLTNTVLISLGSGMWKVNHNNPFKGGFLTRSKGKPNENIHALQLEMSKDLYMSDNETAYDSKKAESVKAVLKKTFESIIEFSSRGNL